MTSPKCKKSMNSTLEKPSRKTERVLGTEEDREVP